MYLIILTVIVLFIVSLLATYTYPCYPHHAFRTVGLLSANKPPLLITRENTFNIVIFSDLHFGEEENGWGIDQDINSTRVMTRILKDENPDLVVVNGDLITGENTFQENSSAYVDQIVRPMVDAGTPWASTYGNHDSKFNLSREALFERETGYDLCYTKRMNSSLPGITNYYLLVYGAEDVPAVILWFFDSRGGSSYQHSPADVDDIPNWVSPETTCWFTKTHGQLRRKYGKAIPSVAFVHIPPHVFLQAQELGLDSKRFPGLNEDVPVAIQGGGTDDAAFVAAIKATEGLHSIHVGHDHGDSWCSTWPDKGVGLAAPFLCFAKHTGYGGYGHWSRGARVLRLSFDDNGDGEMAVQSWVRMEDGSIITRVSLNDTYGFDEYN